MKFSTTDNLSEDLNKKTPPVYALLFMAYDYIRFLLHEDTTIINELKKDKLDLFISILFSVECIIP